MQRFITGVLIVMFWSIGLLPENLPASAPSGAPLIIGIDADMSGGSAQSGEAIHRGAVLAVNEINAAGGILGRPVTLEVRDHRGNPARGVMNMEAFAAMPDLLAVIGGLHTPVALEELALVHQHEIIFLIPWAAGTPIVDNGYDPNFVFRVSVRDEYAGAFLMEKTLAAGYRRPGLLLEQTGWGRSNEKAMVQALEQRGMRVAGVQWFHWGVRDMSYQLESLLAADADVVLLVANAPEGLVALRSMANLTPARRLPLVSHWGITGGDFPLKAGESLNAVDLFFLQTFSFLAPSRPQAAEHLLTLYRQTFGDTRPPEQLPAPPGTAHAYDLIHLLARATDQAGTPDRAAVQRALQRLEEHAGVMRHYAPPFTPERHDALIAADFMIACFGMEGAIVPCSIVDVGPR